MRQKNIKKYFTGEDEMFPVCLSANLYTLGAFINDVTQILRISDPPPPSAMLKWLYYLQLYSDCHKRVTPPFPPSCVTSFMNVPLAEL